MRKLLVTIICLSVLAFSSTAFAAAIGHDNVPVPANLKRNHDVHLIIDGKSAVTITHEYIGKKPKGEYKFKHDYTKIDTDFYVWTLVNHTPYTLEFLTMRTWPERATTGVSIEYDKTKGKEQYSSVTTVDLTKAWKVNTIPPFKTWTRNTHYYYSVNKNWNKRYVEYTIRINGQIYKLTDTLVYIK